MCSLSKEQSILSRETFQVYFVLRNMPLFRLRPSFLCQAPHSRAFAPACGALVFFVSVKKFNNKICIYIIYKQCLKMMTKHQVTGYKFKCVTDMMFLVNSLTINIYLR